MSKSHKQKRVGRPTESKIEPQESQVLKDKSRFKSLRMAFTDWTKCPENILNEEDQNGWQLNRAIHVGGNEVLLVFERKTAVTAINTTA